MADPNLNANQWYYIYVGASKANALLGTNLYNQGREGAIFLNHTQTSASDMRWQIYPINSTTYVLRSQAGGANAFIGTHFVPAEETDGHTRAYMVAGGIADASVFWQFGSWGDDSWWLTNAQNGTQYHLNLKPNGLLTMDANISAAASTRQNWKFGSIAKIDDNAYSSVALPGVTMTSPGAGALTAQSSTVSTTSASASGASSASASTPSTGLSTAGKAGLGAALGLAAIIALVVLGLFWRRKRNARKTSKPEELAYEPYQGQLQQQVAPVLPDRQAENYKHELYHDSGAAKYEMPGQTVTEVDARAQERPAELMGDIERR